MRGNVINRPHRARTRWRSRGLRSCRRNRCQDIRTGRQDRRPKQANRRPGFSALVAPTGFPWAMAPPTSSSFVTLVPRRHHRFSPAIFSRPARALHRNGVFDAVPRRTPIASSRPGRVGRLSPDSCRPGRMPMTAVCSMSSTAPTSAILSTRRSRPFRAFWTPGQSSRSRRFRAPCGRMSLASADLKGSEHHEKRASRKCRGDPCGRPVAGGRGAQTGRPQGCPYSRRCSRTPLCGR